MLCLNYDYVGIIGRGQTPIGPWRQCQQTATSLLVPACGAGCRRRAVEALGCCRGSYVRCWTGTLVMCEPSSACAPVLLVALRASAMTCGPEASFFCIAFFFCFNLDGFISKFHLTYFSKEYHKWIHVNTINKMFTNYWKSTQLHHVFIFPFQDNTF